MSDCNHESIKCMKCHRYVGIHEQIVPTAPAVARIRELESQVERLQNQLARYEPPPARDCAIGGLQHECT